MSTMRRATRAARRLHSVFLAKNFLFAARKTRPDGDLSQLLDQRDAPTNTRLSYQAEPVQHEKLKDLPGLYRERVIATYVDRGKSQKTVLLTFGFDPRYKGAG